jgi:hypothetical protein
VLQHVGFSRRWTNWISILVSTTSTLSATQWSSWKAYLLC